MFCKYCGAELEQEQTLCKSCGKENGEEAPKKKLDTGKIVLSVVACVLLIAVLGMIVYMGAGGTFEDVAKLFRKKENDVFYKDTYIVSDKKAASSADQIVATVGEHTLTNRQLQLYYWMQVYDFIEYTGGYPSSYGVDLSVPLSEQVYDKTTGQTWEQYFVENALMAWRRYVALNEAADEKQYVMPEEYQERVDNVKENLESEAQEGGFASAEEMLAEDIGSGVTLEDYKKYLSLYYRGNLYFTDLKEGLEASQSEIDKYYETYGA